MNIKIEKVEKLFEIRSETQRFVTKVFKLQ